MSDRHRLGDATLRRLHGRAAADARAAVQARRMLVALTPHGGHIHLGRPEPAGVLLRHYREAQRRSHVDWHLLAAVNFVESAFGRLRNDSVAGAQGPMQFIASTWRQYGRGDVHDPRAAILAAGRFLHAAGAPRDERARCTATTRRRSTSAPSSATPAACAATGWPSTRTTPGPRAVRVPPMRTKPPALPENATIAVVAPSSPPQTRSEIEQATAYFEARGHRRRLRPAPSRRPRLPRRHRRASGPPTSSGR